MGFFAMVGPLQVFVSSHVSVALINPSPTSPLHTPNPSLPLYVMTFQA